MNAAGALPPLRQDLGLHAGPPAPDGSPTWTLHDPAVNRFYELPWPAFEVLSRWTLGSVGRIVDAVRRETTLRIVDADVAALRQMLAHNHLLQASSAQDSECLARTARAGRTGFARWMLRHYLCLRVPLVQPMPWLQRLGPHVAWAYRPAFWWLTAMAAVLGWVLVVRRWDDFTDSLAACATWDSAVAMAFAVAFAKVLHELGHAFTAHRHGCRVSTMGIAFVVLWPVLYTDTTEAWKLASRRHRLAIGAGGMLSEIALAAYALLAWALLPETPAWAPLRAAAFQLATTTWLIALTVNASPFMRFDGYFLLSDAINMPNLHERAFALARWWLRERLFGWGDAPPEIFSRTRARGLVAFAFATWLYRLVLFVTIALIVYHVFFKALGVLLMAVELTWFVGRPAVSEMKRWHARRKSLRCNRATCRLAVSTAALLAALLWPWQTAVRVPAVLGAAPALAVYAPHAGQMGDTWPSVGRRLRQGDPLVAIRSPALQARLDLATSRAQRLQWQVAQQTLDARLMEAGPALRKRWEAAREEAEGLQRETQRLNLAMPFDGVVLEVSEDAGPGRWVSAGEKLLRVAGWQGAKVEAFVDESELPQARDGGEATFIADAPEHSPVQCRRTVVDAVPLSELDQVAVASMYGGRIPARQRADGRIVPLRPTFRVRLEGCDLQAAPACEVLGVALLHGERRSLAMRAFRWAAAWWHREAAF
ncbi:HlyD family efflux transporter periplasmic adaptor subunit [Piscinibacter sp. XHJ-5]|uniref:HlyD family efflux transporter periplasmic adaptor subunit n=1 Tax=Piscinibacter sp. XHJ-5 TaxID=3037797 RepID=UPI002452D39F|nr:HlyD family efflux transporter periplasmic adaptor subunit [Piscinibacter sp. XHJ-5]